MTETGPSRCWKELQPQCIHIGKLIATAPIPPNERVGLAVMFLTHAITVAGLEAQAWRGSGSLESHARDMAELALAAAFEHKRPTLKVVAPLTTGGQDE